jgi:hypothetical protein
MLNKGAQELVDRCNGKSPTVGKGEKLTMGADGVWRLERDGERFAKSATASAAPTRLELARAILTNRRVAKVGGSRALDAGFRKRAVAVAVTEGQMRGTAPTVGATPPSERGLSDENIAALENAIAEVVMNPAEAERLLARILAVIPSNPTRQTSVETDAYGVTPDRTAGAFGNAATIRNMVKSALDASVAKMNVKLRTVRRADDFIDPSDPNAAKKMLIKTLRAGGRSILAPAFQGTMGN